jgi:hypothetical protein
MYVVDSKDVLLNEGWYRWTTTDISPIVIEENNRNVCKTIGKACDLNYKQQLLETAFTQVLNNQYL